MLVKEMERATRNMKRIQLVFLAVVACSGASCSKQEPAPTPPPPPLTINKVAPPPTSSSVDVVPTPPPEASAPTSPPAADDETPAGLAAQVKQLETDYQDTTDFQKHVVIIYSLSSNNSTDTIDAISRLFLN
jgi:type IV secretory pathway VirB10-like protein